MKNNFVLPIIIAVIALLLIGAGFYIKYQNNQYSEATLPLPTVNNENGTGDDVSSDSGITGRVTIDACPGPVIGDCANKPYSGDFRLVTEAGALVKNFSSDSNGNFKVIVSPGVYKIEKTTNTSLPKMRDVGLITVKANSFTNINIKFDSGLQ